MRAATHGLVERAACGLDIAIGYRVAIGLSMPSLSRPLTASSAPISADALAAASDSAGRTGDKGSFP
jgi:hypothetical protein